MKFKKGDVIQSELTNNVYYVIKHNRNGLYYLHTKLIPNYEHKIMITKTSSHFFLLTNIFSR